MWLWLLALIALTWAPWLTFFASAILDGSPVLALLVVEPWFMFLTAGLLASGRVVWRSVAACLVLPLVVFVAFEVVEEPESDLLVPAAMWLASVIPALVLASGPRMEAWRNAADQSPWRRTAAFVGATAVLVCTQCVGLAVWGRYHAAADLLRLSMAVEEAPNNTRPEDGAAAATWAKASSLVTGTAAEKDAFLGQYIPGGPDAVALEDAEQFLLRNQPAVQMAREAAGMTRGGFEEGLTVQERCGVAPLDESGHVVVPRPSDRLQAARLLGLACTIHVHRRDLDSAVGDIEVLASFASHHAEAPNYLNASLSELGWSRATGCLERGLLHAAWNPTAAELERLFSAVRDVEKRLPSAIQMMRGESGWLRRCLAVAAVGPRFQWDAATQSLRAQGSVLGLNPEAALYLDRKPKSDWYQSRRETYLPEQATRCIWQDDASPPLPFLEDVESWIAGEESEPVQADFVFLMGHRQRVARTVVHAGLALYLYQAVHGELPASLEELGVELADPCAKEGRIGLFDDGRTMHVASAPYPSSTTGQARGARLFTVRKVGVSP